MNKKQFVLLVCLVVSVTFAVYAQQGGYKGPGTTPVTVEEAKNLRDISFVILQGKIERFLVGDHYLFSDDTGEVTLVIEDRIWGDISVDENNSVEIRGIIARGWGRLSEPSVLVESIRKL